MQVLVLRERGLTNSSIGKELGISKQTVKNHMTRILLKLGEERSAAAVAHLFACERTDCPRRIAVERGLSHDGTWDVPREP